MPSSSIHPSSTNSSHVTTSRNASLSLETRDLITGACDRDTILSALFRETDRAQRMKTSLSLLAFSFHDASDGSSAPLTNTNNNMQAQAIQRIICTLRSYDIVGDLDNREFLIALPGCDSFNAMRLAERLRTDIIDTPGRLEMEDLRLSACFGIAASDGRSPLVVLREAEEALRQASADGPGSIRCFSRSTQPEADPVAFLAPNTRDQSFPW